MIRDLWHEYVTQPNDENLTESMLRQAHAAAMDVQDVAVIAGAITHHVWLKFQKTGDLRKWFHALNYTKSEIEEFLWHGTRQTNESSLIGAVAPPEVQFLAAQITAAFLMLDAGDNSDATEAAVEDQHPEGNCRCFTRYRNQTSATRKSKAMARICRAHHRIGTLSEATEEYRRAPGDFLRKAIDNRANLHMNRGGVFEAFANSMLAAILRSPNGNSFILNNEGFLVEQQETTNIDFDNDHREEGSEPQP